jgi:2-oxoglutarate dehydrogenase complex dehydrogenase (E1) component-like enzyme
MGRSADPRDGADHQARRATGLREVVVGMPHRGRLNILANVMGKPYRAIFNEFQGGSFKPDEVDGSGDVKYHLGASSDREFDGNVVHLSLTANPSHLEAVNPVVLGKVRAKQDQLGDGTQGGSAHPSAWRCRFAGQGVVAEVLRPVRPEGAPHRRHHPYRREQPDRFHHRAAFQPLQPLSHRYRADGGSADFPRQWR